MQNSAVVLCIYLQKKKNTKVRGFFEVRHDTRRVSVYCCFSVVLMLFWWILSSYSVSHKSPRLVSTFAAFAHSLAECSMKKNNFSLVAPLFSETMWITSTLATDLYIASYNGDAMIMCL